MVGGVVVTSGILGSTVDSIAPPPTLVEWRHGACIVGYPIGSGIAEGTCRNLVKDRMDCTGMHWRLPGARAMLKTRVIYLNGEWDDFIEYRIQREQATLSQTAA